MAPGPGNGSVSADPGDRRYQSLLDVPDLVALHTELDGFLPALGAALRTVVEFDSVGLVLLGTDTASGVLYLVHSKGADPSPQSFQVESRVLPPTQDSPLVALWDGRSPIVISDFGDPNGYPDLFDSLQAGGTRSACLLTMTTVVRPVGLLFFASSRTRAYDESDKVFLQHVASQVAAAIDNVRHHDEAKTYQLQLKAERDHWRALLEINNSLVTNLDLVSLLAAITPNLRRMVAHDYTSLFLQPDDSGTLWPAALDPNLPPELAEVIPLVTLRDTPLSRALALGEPVEAGSESLPLLPEALQKHAHLAHVKRVCCVPLVTPRRVIGAVSMARREADPFTDEERDRAAQAGIQIAIALENALAFKEIATLKDRLALENLYLEDEIRGKENFEEIIGDSKALQRVLAQVRSVAPTDTTVLLLGETGTGKELLARALHAMSGRRTRALVTVNCATSPAGLLESEWFGHEKGAFTGALAQKIGRFELANQGTLFLDEVGDIPLDLQSKLLRALQEHEIERLGSTRTIRVDFRLVAATNRSLEEMVATREYRGDLFYRLNVFPIRIPPLRDRRDDIPPLVRYFAQRYAKQMKRTIDSVARDSMDALTRWHWPGNVRELQNVVERAVILSTGPTLRVSLSELELPATPGAGAIVTLEQAERDHIIRALEHAGWVVGGAGGAADVLGVKRTTLVSTMRRLGIRRPTAGGPH